MSTRSKPKSNDQSPARARPLRRLAWFLAASLWAFVALSLASFSVTDWPTHAASPAQWPVDNWAGPVGAAVAYHLLAMLGPGVVVLLLGGLAALAAPLLSRPVSHLALRGAGAMVCAIAVSGVFALHWPRLGPFPEGSGGLLAIALVDALVPQLNAPGSLLALFAMFGVGAIVAADELVLAAPRALWAVARRAALLPRPAVAVAGAAGRFLHRERPAADHMLRPRPAARSKAGQNPDALDNDAFDEDGEPLGAGVRGVPGGPAPRPDEPEEYDDPDAEAEEAFDESAEDGQAGHADADADAEEEGEAEGEELEDEGVDEAEGASALDPEALREKIRKLPISFANPSREQASPPAPPQDLSGYQFPTMDLLIDPELSVNDEIAAHVREQAEALETALQTYRIEGEVVAIDAGPVITRYEVALAPGTKVAQLSNIASDVARELKAQNIRIVPNTAGKSTVGVEVPNLKKEKVRLKDLMALGGEDAREKMALPMYLGKDASGNPLIDDLCAMPHMLIAGTTGSGKSVCMNSIIMSFLFTRRPDELKLVLVDPKMVEMSQFKDVPHLMCPVITDMAKAAASLEWAVTKMDERYELLAEAGCRDIDGYNALTEEDLEAIFEPQNEAERAKIPQRLPRLVFVIDELADLMMTNKEVESFIVRIAQKARAVGIHLILATQRPQANVVTGLIKSNMPCRVAFKVSSGMDSRIVLDQKGAELLLGQGDMLYFSPRTSKLTRAQGTLVDDQEIRKSVRFLKDVAQPSFEPQLVQLRGPGASDEDSGERDALFEDAVKVVLESQRGSVSLLQRRLAIGYSRASRLIEEMAQAGLIGTYKGSQAREVTMTLEEWEAMKAQAEADAAADAGELTYEAEDEDLGETSWDEEDGGTPDEMDGEYRR